MIRLLALAALSWVLTIAMDAAAASPAPPPRFEEYPVETIYEGPKAPAKLRPGTDAWPFRSAIREAYSRTAVNFAGRFVAVEWGCGAPCQQWAVVDAQSGAVYMVPFPTAGGANYRRDSRLFVADPPHCAADECEGPSVLQELHRGAHTVYYQWDGQALHALYSVGRPVPSNKALQPTPAAEPNGQRETARVGPRG